MKLKHVVCGGTFDHLHAGHKKLLEACMEQGERVTIGITDRAMTRHKQYASLIQPYSVRCNYVKKFAAQYSTPVSLIKITDIYGSTLKDRSIDALFVTEETMKGAKRINDERIKIGMKPLSIVVIPFVYDDARTKISSERIRGGQISREGTNYYKYLISEPTHILPESLREELRSPLGRVIPTILNPTDPIMRKMKDVLKERSSTLVVSVGDVVTYNLKKNGITPSVSIIDGITQRKALKSEVSNYIYEKDRCSALNKKGTIQRGAIEMFNSLVILGHQGAIKQLFIEGEEDLLTLVAVLLVPLDSYVWYGQQGVGAIYIHVTEKIKRKVYNLINQFV